MNRWAQAKAELEQVLVERPQPRRRSVAPTRYAAITVMQPYAWLLAHAAEWPTDVLGKTVENRSCPTNYRGPLLIHTSRRWEKVGSRLAELRRLGLVGGDCPEPTFAELRAQLGQVIAVAELIGCRKVGDRDVHPWATAGSWAWELACAEPVEPFELRGNTGLWFAAPGLRVKPLRMTLRGLAPLPGFEVDATTGWASTIVGSLQEAASVLFRGGAKAFEQIVELDGERMTAIELIARAAEDFGEPDTAAYFRKFPGRYRWCTAARRSCTRGPLAHDCGGRHG